MYWNPNTKGFYEGEAPEGMANLTQENVDALLQGEREGKEIYSIDGKPGLRDPEPKQMTAKEVAELRRVAYSVESDPLYMEWQFDQTDHSEAAWRAKVSEIKARYPMPSSDV